MWDTGKFTRSYLDSLSRNDWRRGSKYFQEPQLSANLDLVDKLKPIASRNDLTLAQLAVAWVLRRQEVTSAIVGARRPDQIEGTVPAGDAELSDDDIHEIERLLAKRAEASTAAV